jgi:hypothetical protein
MNAAYLQARNIALTLLGSVDVISTADVHRAVAQVVPWVAGMFPNVPVDEEALRRDVESLCAVWVPGEKTLNGDDDHQQWLDKKRGQIQWSFWERYERYLEMEKGWAPAQLRGLREATDGLLANFEDPKRTGKWDRRGMVVGQVQSGKTANYTGLICKAADAGYRLIVVLAGLHNSLRSQTQERLDREFLGFDTRTRRSFDQGNARIGVGAMKGQPFLHVHSLTSSDQKGDFQRKVAQQVWVQAGGGDPVLLVVKKNASVLRNLYDWSTDVLKETDPETGLQIVRNVPLLVIDDEADNASVNTKARPTDENGRPVEDYDPTKINGWIRRLLRTFEKSAYLAYTATPFANIFIDEDEETETFGEDLFPRSFIVSLRPPTNYTGVARVFGLDGDIVAGIEEEEGLPVLRPILDQDPWIPDKHKKDWDPGPLPESLMEAIGAFLLASAVRRARGQQEHNSMLVHVTRFTDVQAHVQRSLRSYLALTKSRMEHGKADDPNSPWIELRALWDRDFVPTTELLLTNPNLVLEIGREVTWDEVSEQLLPVLDDLEVKTMNGTSEDSLAYSESESPLTLLAVGGDKLSRGLTLEGLTVSYYLRASKMYDTLMQMGRWFGYRRGYLDVCRLYTTPELAGWYRDIAVANEELLREFDYMVALGKNPKDYGLRVRAHPDGLMVTAAAKMRNGVEVDVTFSQTISESIVFETDRRSLQANLAATEDLIRRAGAALPREPGKTILWPDVPAADVLRFLGAYRNPDTATKARPPALAEYIRTRLGASPPELTSWTVALISTEEGNSFSIAGYDVGLIRRAMYLPHSQEIEEEDKERGLVEGKDRFVLRRLVNPTDEQLDLSNNQKHDALVATIKAWRSQEHPRSASEPSRAGGLQVRELRSRERGLLLLYPLQWRPWMAPDLPPIGFALSFPGSKNAKKVKYRVNNVWWEQEFGTQGDDEE